MTKEYKAAEVYEGELPIVDLALQHGTDAERAEFTRNLDRGLFEIGFFLLKNTPGLTPEFVDQVIAKSHAFYDLPQDKKDKYSVNRYWKGYVKLGDETTHYQVNFRENLDFGVEHTPFDPEDESIPLAARMFYGPNVWPSEEDVPGFRETLTRYFDYCAQANVTILHLMLERFGYEGGQINKFDRWFSFGQGLDPDFLGKISHYPPIREVDIVTDKEKREPKEWLQGCGPHTDTAFYTILVGDQPGLQVQLHSGKWIDVPVLPGHVVVNFGRMLSDLTHGALEATTHRVNTALVNARRISVPYFMVPSYAEPLPEFITKEKAAELLKRHGVGGNPRPDGKLKEVVTDVDPTWDGDNLESFQDRAITNRVRQYPAIAKKYWPKAWLKYGLPTKEELAAAD